MRVLILVLSVLGMLIGADAATGGPSTTNRDLSASVDPATFTDEATQETEDQIGLDEGKRRDVQRRLTGLGFDTNANGTFDELTRAAIMRWQVARLSGARAFSGTSNHPGTGKASSGLFDGNRSFRRGCDYVYHR